MKLSINHERLLIKIVFAVAVITAISGLIQMLLPSFMLAIVGGEQRPAGTHSFAIIGMFMLLFGGLLIHSLASQDQNPIAVLWCTLQKLGAAVAVYLGVEAGYFSSLALLIAGFDFLSFLLLLFFWLSIKNTQILSLR